jgi:molecular chaperone GrpE
MEYQSSSDSQTEKPLFSTKTAQAEEALLDGATSQDNEIEQNSAATQEALEPEASPIPLQPLADAQEQVEDEPPPLAQSGALEEASNRDSVYLHRLLQEVEHLRADFETKVQYDESKERLISTLHAELQTYREGFHFKILRPVLMDLISMHGDLDRIIESMTSQENAPSPIMLRNLRSFQISIEQTLQRYEVDAFAVEGDVLVAGKQQILRAVDTDNLALDRHIARRVRTGFAYSGRILRPEIVEIYRFNPKLVVKESEA